MKRFVMGNIPFLWNGKIVGLSEMGNMSLFLSDEETDEHGFSFEEKEMDVVAFENARVIKKTGGYELLETEKGIFLMNHWAENRFGYGFYLHEACCGCTEKIYVNPKMEKNFSVSAERFFSTIGLHRMLLKKKALIMHSSYVVYKGKALLFTAPSQTGKSTQAALWQEHEGALIVNGDRALLRKKGDLWYAFGYPCCGSSGICLNCDFPVGAVVILRKGEENRLKAVSPAQAVNAVVSASELYNWNGEEVLSAFSVAEDAVKEIPFFELECRAEKEAVDLLKKELEAMNICQ